MIDSQAKAHNERCRKLVAGTKLSYNDYSYEDEIHFHCHIRKGDIKIDWILKAGCVSSILPANIGNVVRLDSGDCNGGYNSYVIKNVTKNAIGEIHYKVKRLYWYNFKYWLS